MDLTNKQLLFCENIAKGKTKSDAYRAAYNTKNMKDSTINVRASELFNNGKIRVRVSELQAENKMLCLWEREQSIQILASISMGDDPDGKARDRVSAVKALNSMHGYDAPIRNEHSVEMKQWEPICDEDFLG